MNYLQNAALEMIPVCHDSLYLIHPENKELISRINLYGPTILQIQNLWLFSLDYN